MFVLGRQSALYLRDTRLLRARFGSSSKCSPAPISCPATEKLVPSRGIIGTAPFIAMLNSSLVDAGVHGDRIARQEKRIKTLSAVLEGQQNALARYHVSIASDGATTGATTVASSSGGEIISFLKANIFNFRRLCLAKLER